MIKSKFKFQIINVKMLKNFLMNNNGTYNYAQLIKLIILYKINFIKIKTNNKYK